MAEAAEIRLYPLDAPIVRDGDLTLRNVVVASGEAAFDVAVTGNGTVTRTTVQGRSAAQVVFQVELSDLRNEEPQSIRVTLPSGATGEDLEIVVDPFNDVFESDEYNNTWFAVAREQ